MTLKIIGHLFYATSSIVHHFVAIGEFKLELEFRNAEFGSNLTIFRAMRPSNLMYDLEKNRAPLLCYFKLCKSFRSHWWIETGVTVVKRPIWIKIGDFLSCVTLQFDVWSCKTIGDLFYATSSFVHHFVAIGDFKLEIQSGNAQFGSKSTIFIAGWPCNLMYDLKKHRAPLQCYFKLCASFRSHWWIKIGVTVRKQPILVKIDDFFSRVTLQFDVWPWKTIGHLLYFISSLVHHFVVIVIIKLELQSRSTQFGSNLTFFRAGVWPWNLKDDCGKQQGTSSMLLQALCIIS